jgi:thiamine biosynthesis lipoprotein
LQLLRYLIPFLILTLVGCENTARNAETGGAVKTERLAGKTMGTTWSVVLLAGEFPLRRDAEDFKVAVTTTIDSLLVALNDEVSNWEKGSTVVLFNESAAGIDLRDATYFLDNYQLAKRVNELTGGAFEPTILPLTDYWGFGSGIERIEAGVDTTEVMRRLALVGMERIELEGDTFLRKLQPRVQLDLGGSAKGYGTDLITQLLRRRYQLENFLVEIGGEMYAAGRKSETQNWRIGINLPKEEAAFNAIAETMPLENKAVATSGNYRNYYKVGGETYSHTLNPKTGFPERNRLLSASVIAPNCATADAFATACMVLGPEAALALIEQQPELEAYFLVRAEDGTMLPVLSSGLSLK